MTNYGKGPPEIKNVMYDSAGGIVLVVITAVLSVLAYVTQKLRLIFVQRVLHGRRRLLWLHQPGS